MKFDHNSYLDRQLSSEIHPRQQIMCLVNTALKKGKFGKMDLDALSKAFMEHHYSMFDVNRAELSGLYQEDSMLTFEGQKIQGAQNITNNLLGLPFPLCFHNRFSKDDKCTKTQYLFSFGNPTNIRPQKN